MSSVVNQSPFLRTSREFPEDIHILSVQVNKSYVDIANAVNSRTISLFPTNRPAITGESFFLANNQRQQSFRQVYPFGTIAPGTPLFIPYTTNGFTQFSRIYGTCLTAGDARPLPYASLSANGNIEVRINTSTSQIVVFNGAANPTINSGIIVLEWLSAV